MRRSLDVPRLECTHKAIVKVYDYPGRLIFKSFERRITCNKLEAAALRFGELAGAYRSIERPPQLAGLFHFLEPRCYRGAGSAALFGDNGVVPYLVTQCAAAGRIKIGPMNFQCFVEALGRYCAMKAVDNSDAWLRSLTDGRTLFALRIRGSVQLLASCEFGETLCCLPADIACDAFLRSLG